jgi:hypothetical protein
MRDRMRDRNFLPVLLLGLAALALTVLAAATDLSLNAAAFAK